MRALQHEHWAFTLFAVPSLGAISASAFVPWVQHKAAWGPRGDLRIPNTGCTGTRNRVSDLARWSNGLDPHPRTLTLPTLCSDPDYASDLRADDGIRTRDPHLGKVVSLPGHKRVTLFHLPFRAGGCHLVPRVAKP
jgi:hypothetical protein